MISSRFLQPVLLLFALATFSSAQLTDVPNIVSSIIGATPTSKSSSASSSASSSKAMSSATSASQATSTSGAATSTTSFVGLSGVPTISAYAVPALIVPDTAGAPFMQKSDLPADTVFIAVGAILGFLLLCVLAWRVLVAWSLKRPGRRAAAAPYTLVSEKNPSYPTGPSGYSSTYASNFASNNVSMENLAAATTAYKDDSGRRSSKNPKTAKTARASTNSSLFFSPTAGATAAAQGISRASAYLPSGYYASGASAPAAGATSAHIGGPPAAGYGRLDTYGSPSPPRTPAHSAKPSRDGGRSRVEKNTRPMSNMAAQESSSSLVAPPQPGRAPSAYLEDLFENHGNGPREMF